MLCSGGGPLGPRAEIPRGFCRGCVVVLVDHASGIFACRAYGLPPLEADSVIFGFALLIEMCFFDCCRGRVVVLLILGFALLIEVE